MEHIVAEEKRMSSNENEQPHQAAKAKPRKGGFRTMPFIIGTQILTFIHMHPHTYLHYM